MWIAVLYAVHQQLEWPFQQGWYPELTNQRTLFSSDNPTFGKVTSYEKMFPSLPSEIIENVLITMKGDIDATVKNC